MNICLPSIFIFTRLPRLIQQWMGGSTCSTVSLVDDYDGRYRNWNWHRIWRLFMNQVVVMGLYSTNLVLVAIQHCNGPNPTSGSCEHALFLYQLFVELKTMMSLWPLPSLTIPYPHYRDIESEALGFDSVSQGNCAPRYNNMDGFRVINLPTARGFWRLPIHLEGVPQVTATATRAVGQLQAATCLDSFGGIYKQGRGFKLVNYHGSARCI